MPIPEMGDESHRAYAYRLKEHAEKLEAHVAELKEALSLAPCECDQLRGFDKCPRCLALNK